MLLNRRQFIISGLAAGSYVALSRPDLGSLFGSGSERIGLGIIGLGNRGLLRLQESCAAVNVEVKAVCDINPSRLEAVKLMARDNEKLKYSLRTESAEAIFERDDIQAVSVTVPVAARPGLVRRASAAGKHVFVEAPWASTLEESAEVAALAAQSSASIQQASYDPDWDDENFDRYLRAAQNKVKAVRLNVFLGAPQPRTEGPLIFGGFDLLGATARWIGGGAAASVAVVGGGYSHALSESAALRFCLDEDEGKQIVMLISRTPRLGAGEVEAHVASESFSGQKGLFIIKSAGIENAINTPGLSGGTRFKPARLLESERLVRARQTHHLNSLMFMAAESLRVGSPVRRTFLN